MNTAQITNLVPETEEVELSVIEKFEATRQTAQPTVWRTRLRRALLACILLLLTSLALVARSSIAEIESQLEMIRTDIATKHAAPGMNQAHDTVRK